MNDDEAHFTMRGAHWDAFGWDENKRGLGLVLPNIIWPKVNTQSFGHS